MRTSDDHPLQQRAGFTLVELLVVIAIIGLLATLAVVAYRNSAEKARDARAISSLNQFRKALELCYDKRGSYQISSETRIDTPCFRESVTDADFLSRWQMYCSEFMESPPVKIAGTRQYAIHTSDDYMHVALLAELETNEFAMSSSTITSLLQSANITDWIPCTEYNYAIVW